MAQPFLEGVKASDGTIFLRPVKPLTLWQKFLKWLGAVVWHLVWLFVGFLAGLIVGGW